MKRKTTSEPVAIGDVLKPIMARMEEKARAAGFQSSDNSETQRADAFRANELLKAAGVPRRQLEAEHPLRGDTWRQWMEHVASHLGKGILVAFIGDRGPGKTQMAVELIKLATAGLMSAKYATAMEFFIEVKGAYRDDSGAPSEKIVIDQFTKPRLLVLDEIQERGATAWEDRLLTHLVDVRYREMRDTILIGNLTKDELVAELGRSIVSRLTETGGFIDFKWPSFRAAIAKKRSAK